jgi:hypothetical protein
MAVIDGSVTVRKALRSRPLSFDKELVMFVIPTISINYAFAVTTDCLKGFIESSIKAGLMPRDALVSAPGGRVIGAVNGGVYNPFPV